MKIQRRNRNYLMWTSLVTLAANSTNYVDSAVQIENQYDYRVRPTAGPFSQVKSVMLAVPSISAQPQSDTVFSGATATLSVFSHWRTTRLSVVPWYQRRHLLPDRRQQYALSDTDQSYGDRILLGACPLISFGQTSSDAATLTVLSVIQWPIYVDFGTVPTTNPDESDRYWNNVTSPSMTLDLISSNGSPTELDLFADFFTHLGQSSVNSLTNSPYTMTAAQDSLSVYNVSDGTVSPERAWTRTKPMISAFTHPQT